MERHEITLPDGRVFESCSQEEWLPAQVCADFTGANGESLYYRLKKQEPRSCEGKIMPFSGGRVMPVPADWPVGMKVRVTEVIE